MIRILIVDDQEMIRAGLAAVLGASSEINVVGQEPDGLAALKRLEAGGASGDDGVDVVLLDIRMPGIDGVEVTRRIRANARWNGIKVVILTTFDQDENVLAALRAGADGFMNKGMSAVELLTGIKDVHEGGGALSAAASKLLIGRVSNESPFEPDSSLAERFEQLTERELEVVVVAAGGLDNKEVGEQLSLSPLTVKTHLSRAMNKTGARDRAQLVAFAYRAGLLR